MSSRADVPEIDGFTFVREVGRGAVATVWEARQHDPDRVVAIKFLREDITGSPEDVEAFYAEAKRAAELDHENIVTVFEVGCQHGYYYYVMELASGYDTAKWLRRKGHLKQDDVLTVAESVAVALEYAERTIGLIHCDIKPGNIMVDGDGTVRITDLGIARLARGWNADEGYICGTPQFMSPEQAKGEVLDARADIYSLGATMYALLSGHRLFDGRPDAEIMDAQCNEYVSDVREFNPDVTYPLAALIAQMLAKNRDERIQNWPTVIDSIHRVMSGEMPIGAIPDGSTMKLEEYSKPTAGKQAIDGQMAEKPTEKDSPAPSDGVHVPVASATDESGNASRSKTAAAGKSVAKKTVHIHVTHTSSPIPESKEHAHESAEKPVTHEVVRLEPPTKKAVAVVKRELDSTMGFVIRTAIASIAVFVLAFYITKYFVSR